MTQAQIGTSNEPRPHAYDPVTQPELFQGVLARRFAAFLIDALIILIPLAAVVLFMLVFTVVTLGFGAVVFGLLGPIAALWAILYVGVTLGSERSATYGIRLLRLQMRTWYGAPMYFLLGAVHAILFPRIPLVAEYYCVMKSYTDSVLTDRSAGVSMSCAADGMGTPITRSG